MTALTTRETDVMRLICEGLTAQGIGEVLGISSRTVEVHRHNATLKLGARNQTHAAVLFDRAEATARIEALTAEVRRLDYSGIHTCHAECPRLPCAQRREIEALTVRAEAAEARNKVLEDRLRHIANYYPAGHRITELALEALGGEHA